MNTDQLKTKIGQVPALFVFKKTLFEASQNGVILFYHGLGASKETNFKELESLADAGFLAVGLDVCCHGERRSKDFDSQFDEHSPNFELELISAIKNTADEVPKIIDELIANYKISSERIGISGISMGGYIAYKAVTIDRRIKTAVPILGSPQWNVMRHESPCFFLNNFFPAALLAQNAGKDHTVPPFNSKKLYNDLLPYYKQAPERLGYVEYPESGHFMLEYEWNELWSNTINWFLKFM